MPEDSIDGELGKIVGQLGGVLTSIGDLKTDMGKLFTKAEEHGQQLARVETQVAGMNDQFEKRMVACDQRFCAQDDEIKDVRKGLSVKLWTLMIMVLGAAGGAIAGFIRRGQ